MSADDGAGADVERSCKQFREKSFVEHDWVAAMTLVRGEDNGFFGLVEGSDECADKMNGDQGMIDEEENDRFNVFFAFNRAEGDVERGERAFFPVFVDEDLIGREAELGADLVGVATKDYASETDARVTGGGEQVFEEGEAAVRDQRFGTTHAAGFTGGKNDGGDHKWVWGGIKLDRKGRLSCHFV